MGTISTLGPVSLCLSSEHCAMAQISLGKCTRTQSPQSLDYKSPRVEQNHKCSENDGVMAHGCWERADPGINSSDCGLETANTWGATLALQPTKPGAEQLGFCFSLGKISIKIQELCSCPAPASTDGLMQALAERRSCAKKKINPMILAACNPQWI